MPLSGLPVGKLRFPGGILQCWFGDAVTSNGIAIFYPTSDGTPAGSAVFQEIASAYPAAETNSGSFTAMPLTVVKTIAPDRTSVTVNCFTGTVLGLLGATVLPAPDGTLVHLLIWGS